MSNVKVIEQKSTVTLHNGDWLEVLRVLRVRNEDGQASIWERMIKNDIEEQTGLET